MPGNQHVQNLPRTNSAMARKSTTSRNFIAFLRNIWWFSLDLKASFWYIFSTVSRRPILDEN
jgi:hypothetical protein